MYPDACTNLVPVQCLKNGQDAPRYEADRDGDAPWAGNNATALLKPPDQSFWSWGGKWASS